MVDRHAYAAEAPALGEVVLYRVPGPDGQPGADRKIGRVTAIEPDRYFLQGDNTDESIDSRRLGTIARADILGRVLYISYSIDPTSHEVRFERTGAVVK